jgi:hypothetical protein
LTAYPVPARPTPPSAGLAAVQRAGFEYEFTLTMSLNVNHVGNITKDRTGKYQDRFIEKPDAEFGKELIEWLAQGEKPSKPLPAQSYISTSLETLYAERKAVLNEISEIFQAKSANGSLYFSEDELSEVRMFCKTCDVSAEGITKLYNQRDFLMRELTQRRNAAAKQAV